MNKKRTNKTLTKKNTKRTQKNMSNKKMLKKNGSTKKKLSEWQLLVKKTVKENPKLTFGECLKLASKNRKKLKK
jgi:hypothetical protein